MFLIDDFAAWLGTDRRGAIKELVGYAAIIGLIVVFVFGYVAAPA